MSQTVQGEPQRVLIVSSHPLFGKGLFKLLKDRIHSSLQIVSTFNEAVSSIEKFRPDMVIMDYDDEQINRHEFLLRYLEGALQLRVVLLSLTEDGSQAIVYDRHTHVASQIEDWLHLDV